jgi:hypothetical protein
MPPRSALANISFTVDSASEDEMARDDLNAFPTPDSNTENKAPTRKPRGKAAQKAAAAPATKATAKTKTTTRRVSGGSVLGVKKQNAAVTKKATAKSGRKVLAERQHANMSDTEEVDEFDGEEEAPVEPVKPVKRGRPAKAQKVQEDESLAEIPAPTRKTRKDANATTATKAPAKSKATTKSRATKRAPEPEPEPESMIMETQADPEPEEMDIEESIEVDEIPETAPPPPRPTVRRQPRGARQESVTRRAGSVSDTERDPVLRRKLGEITKKLEAMTAKYDNLKDVATSSRDSNFELLKKRTEQTAKDQDAVIKALKQQITEMQSRSSDITSMRRDMAKLEKENARLAAENKSANASLTSVQNENKTLSTKLAAARSSAPPESKNAPGSAMKARGTGVVLPGTAEAAKEAQLKQQKIDLYSDLTNLVVVGVKKGEEGEDIYDCLQTGRNGSKFSHLPGVLYLE